MKEKKIGNTAKAIIKRGNKLLSIRCIRDGDTYYALPGGQQHFGENLKQTLMRECKEEIDCEIIVNDLFCITERPTCGLGHMVDHYFLCDLQKNSVLKAGNHPDAAQESIEWIPIDEIEKYNLHPLTIRKIIAGTEKRKTIYCGEGT